MVLLEVIKAVLQIGAGYIFYYALIKSSLKNSEETIERARATVETALDGVTIEMQLEAYREIAIEKNRLLALSRLESKYWKVRALYCEAGK